MFREVRKIPFGWQHPMNQQCQFIPLLGASFSRALAEWEEERRQWACGFRCDFSRPDCRAFIPRSDDELAMPYEAWGGPRPSQEDYIPECQPGQPFQYVMYDIDHSAGTPVSPPFPTMEELSGWLERMSEAETVVHQRKEVA